MFPFKMGDPLHSGKEKPNWKSGFWHQHLWGVGHILIFTLGSCNLTQNHIRVQYCTQSQFGNWDHQKIASMLMSGDWSMCK